MKQRRVSSLLHARLSHSQKAFLFSKDESRIKATVMDVKPVDYRDYAKRLIMNIKRNM